MATMPTATTTDLGSVPVDTTSGEPLQPLYGVDKAITQTAEPVHNGKRYLTEGLAYDHLAYAWSSRKKWFLLTIVAVCQTSKCTMAVQCDEIAAASFR
jgi:hypothetical protein